MPMEEISMQNQHTVMEKVGNVVLDIDTLSQPSEKCCSGSPQLSRSFSQKGSHRIDKWNNLDQEANDTVKKPTVKVVRSPLDQFKQSPLRKSKSAIARTSSPMLQDSGEGRTKRFQPLMAINPRKILLTFATMSSMGTMILIYFTLSINRKAGA